MKKNTDDKIRSLRYLKEKNLNDSPKKSYSIVTPEW